MYNKGDLLITTPPCEEYKKEGYCDCEEPHAMYDSRTEDGDIVDCPLPCVYLPHSCDEWIIGGAVEIKALISDLREALKTIGV